MKRKIICIEDDEAQKQYYSLLLDKMHIDYNIFSNPIEALTYFNNNKKEEIHLIITDYRMPFINGCEFIQKLSVDIKSQIPIIMITAQNISEIKEFDNVSKWIAQLTHKPINHRRFQELILLYLN